MPFYNLPALRSDASIPDPAGYGRWEAVPNLNALADSLAVGTERADAAQLKSIPDAWAQAQVFQQALLDKSHLLHEDILAQWRGLIATIALQPEYSTVYDLEVVSLNLEDQGSRGRFTAVLRHLLPTTSLAPDKLNWAAFSSLLFRERTGGAGPFSRSGSPQAIGFLSPSTLVCSGKDAFKLRCAAAPWLANGLSDPLKVEGLAPRHYQILEAYIKGLAVELKSMEAPTSLGTSIDGLMERLEDYFEEAHARVDAMQPLKEAPLRVDWPRGFAFLGRSNVFDADRLPIGHSDCALPLRPETGAVFKGLILVDPSLAETFGRPPEAVTVWGRYSLRDAANPATLARIREEAATEGYNILEPRDFFSDELVCFSPGTLIKPHKYGFEGALLPFSPVVLLIFKPETLAAAAELDIIGDDYKVRLNIVLASGKQHALRKMFGPNAGVEAHVQLDEARPDDLAIWPNFSARNWQWNYLHFQCNPKYELIPRFALSGEFLASDLTLGTVGVPDRIRRLSEWDDPQGLRPEKRLFTGSSSEVRDAAGRLLLQRLRFAETENLLGEFQRLPLGAEAIFFARRQDAEGTERPVGLCIVERTAAPLTHSDAKVAIDFGTTNTVAYEVQGSQSSPIVFEDRLVFPIQHTLKEAEQRERLVGTYTQFFPLRRHETPFPTVAKRREFRAGASGLDENLWAQLQAGHDAHGYSDCIFFVPQFDKIEGTHSFLEWTAKGILVFGIKWARGEAERRLTKRFLRQTMMMCAAEMAARGVDPRSIKWRFSYPQAFSRQDQRDLEAFVHDAWSELFDRLDAKDHIEMETEGAAAAHYFMFGRELDQINAGKLMLMLDIGGGTTDVAVWYNEQLRWRNSVKLAGGDFFTRLLANNIRILDKIDFSDVVKTLNDHKGGALSADAKLNFVELFVNAPSFSRNFDKNFPAFSMEKEGSALRQCASVAVGGIFYYVGLVLKELVAQGVVSEHDLNGLTLAFAGRGSALLRYFDRGPAHDTHLHHLAKLVPIGAGLDPAKVRIDTLFSKKPKHEVALGLLTRVASSQTTKESRFAPIGETIDLNIEGQRVKLGAGDDVRRLLGASDPREAGLEELRRFLGVLKAQTGIEVDLSKSAEAERQIQQAAGAELRRALRELSAEDLGEDTQFVEPLFITELRALVNVMNLPADQRDKMLTVREQVR